MTGWWFLGNTFIHIRDSNSAEAFHCRAYRRCPSAPSKAAVITQRHCRLATARAFPKLALASNTRSVIEYSPAASSGTSTV